jgi:hypothetical protein
VSSILAKPHLADRTTPAGEVDSMYENRFYTLTLTCPSGPGIPVPAENAIRPAQGTVIALMPERRAPECLILSNRCR